MSGNRGRKILSLVKKILPCPQTDSLMEVEVDNIERENSDQNMYSFEQNDEDIYKLIDQEKKLSLVCSRTMAAMSLGFIVLVTPWTIQEVVAACTGSRAPPGLDFVATWMALSNSFWYPFIYWTLNNHFRRICRDIFGGVICRKSQEKKQHQIDCCNASPTDNYIGHTPDCDLEGLSEKYWGEILERTVSTNSLQNTKQSKSKIKMDCNGSIELNLLSNSASDL